MHFRRTIGLHMELVILFLIAVDNDKSKSPVI